MNDNNFKPSWALIEVGEGHRNEVEQFMMDEKIYFADAYYYPSDISPEDLKIEIEDLKPFYENIKVFVGGDKEND